MWILLEPAANPLLIRVGAQEAALEEGDILVGDWQPTANAGWGAGAIKRVRGGSVSVFCESQARYFLTPDDVIVDSSGRVVFLAPLAAGSNNGNFMDRGLFRCNTLAAEPELLGVLHGTPTQFPQDPIPFPGTTFDGARGLHLVRARTALIDDDVNDGAPRFVTEDVYAFVASLFSHADGRRTGFKLVRYHTETGIWDEGPEPVQVNRTQVFTQIPDAYNYGGATYTANDTTIRRSPDPLRLEISGSAGDNEFGIRLDLFGGYKEVGGGPSQGTFIDMARHTFVLDDLTIPNTPMCPPDPSGISSAAPYGAGGGGYNVLTGIEHLVVTRLSGVVVTSNSGAAGAPYLTDVGEALLNDDPSDDTSAKFLRYEFGCIPQRKVTYTPLMGFWNPENGDANSATALAATADGKLIANQWWANRVVRVVKGDGVIPIATGFVRLGGIAAYPPYIPPTSGHSLVIRVDSPVDVLVTDATGRRIGVDAAGQPVNDFGDMGHVGDPGEPRFFAIKNPAAGHYDVQAFGTGEGRYTIHLYSSDLTEDQGRHVKVSGTARFGAETSHDFTLAPDGSVSGGGFASGPPPDTTPPVIEAVLSEAANPAGWHRRSVTVTWHVTDPDGAIASSTGCDATTISENTAGTTLTCSANNAAGLSGSRSAIVKLDRTAPEIAGTRAPAANAAGWNNTAVSVQFACSDSLSGIAANTAPSATLLSSEGAGQSAAGTCTDAAGNSASAEVSAINIDLTRPSITGAAAPDANASGWNNAPVTVAFVCDDALSGIGTCGPQSQVISDEGAGQSRSATAVDQAGNSASTTIGNINIDLTAPVVTCSATPASLWPPKHDLRAVHVAVTVADSLSGTPGFSLTSATSTSGDVADDIQGFTTGTADVDGLLRAVRDGGQTGRRYLLGYSAADHAGNVSTCTSVIHVARER